ncbi:MAG: MMPL family transporter [Parvibaculum sp.]|nr:MMPL family transporter [Parvibaculum sp.]
MPDNHSTDRIESGQGIPGGRGFLRSSAGIAVGGRWIWIAAFFLLIGGLGIMGAGALGALVLSRFEAPGSEALQAKALLEARFETGNPNALLLVTAKGGTVDDPEIVLRAEALQHDLADWPEIAEITSYWEENKPTLRSKDGRHAIIMLRIPGDATESRAILTRLSPAFTMEDEIIQVSVGGGDEVFRQVGEQARQDFIRAEMIVIPLVFVLLCFAMRGIVAAFLPLLIAIFSLTGTLSVLFALTRVLDVSTFALNLALVLAVGLGVDYSLFIISRFREEVGKGVEARMAARRAAMTAGRTVFFSGLTVAVSLLALLLFPFPFLQSLAYAGIAVVAWSVIGAVFFLPAILAVLGRGIDWLRIGRRREAASPGAWHRLAMAAMRRPGAFGIPIVALLLLLGSPVAGLQFGLPDDRILPPSASSRQVQEVIRSDFGIEEMDAIRVVSTEAASIAPTALADYASSLSRVDGVAWVDSAAGSFSRGVKMRDEALRHHLNEEGRGFLVSVVPETNRLERDPYGFIGEIRALDAPGEVQVGGYPADLTDFRATLMERLPLALGFILIVTFIILFLMTGSLLMPLKATVLNLMSLSVMFGCLVFVFQDGNFADLLGFTPTGSIEPSIPILMFCVAYGLSMDYEVFMISRIKEEYDRTGDTVAAAAAGIARSAPLISTAALILATSFAVYAVSDVVFLKMLGIGTALTIAVDATLIRGILVPVFMRVAGKANWWAPAGLRRLHERFGIRE